MSKENILLHACCAPCAGYVINKLSMDFNPVIYYFNPNIYPLEEYARRRDELKSYCQRLGITFIEEEYNYRNWSEKIKGLEQEPEKGLRCTECFRFRLEKTADYAVQNNFPYFTTTLTVSPHKNSTVILETGRQAASGKNVVFLAENFKKQDGFKKAMEIAKKECFYRQTYCGCYYSSITRVFNQTAGRIPKT